MRTSKTKGRTVWKVVKQPYKDWGTHLNLKSTARKRSLRLEYKLNRKVKPKIGKLFAFRTRRAAEDFASRNGAVVYKAVATGITRPTHDIPCLDVTLKWIRKFWDDPKLIRNHIILEWYNVWTTPDDTIWCETITLKERME